MDTNKLDWYSAGLYQEEMRAKELPMDTKKLDRWARLLLDTGKRNNLINFKDTKTATAEVLLPQAETLFRKIEGQADFEVFDPQIEEDDPLKEGDAETCAPCGRSEFLAAYSGKIKKQSQILLYNSAGTPIAALKNIEKKARSLLEETGVNVAYMAFGFVHWKESASAETAFRAPLLLAPIRIGRSSSIEPYLISSTEDDIIVNPTFSYKMEAEHGVKLPELEDEGLAAYLEKVAGIASRLQWKVTAECKIGIFSFLKINMYRDLKDNAQAILQNPNVRCLLGEGEGETFGGSGDESLRAKNPLIELRNVVDADSSQIEAIQMARSGASFVLQGPPGTGKSQTITNIIAECLSCGKRVLFVSEKLAALNVVHDKLKQAGLADFCLELHSHKANKKDVIADICATLRAEKSAVSSKAAAEVALKERALRQLDDYATELHKARPVIERSVYQLYEAYSALAAAPDVEWAVPGLREKGHEYLADTAQLLDQFAGFAPSVGEDYRGNVWFGYTGDDASYQARTALKADLSSIVQCLAALVPLLEEIAARYAVQCSGFEDARSWQAFFGFAARSKVVTARLLSKAGFDTAHEILPSLKEMAEEILSLRNELSAVFDDEAFELDGDDLHKKLALQYCGVFSRLFGGEYKKIVANLRFLKKDKKKPSYREACSLAERLSALQKKRAAFAKAEEPAKALLGDAYCGLESDWAYINEQMATLASFFSELPSIARLEAIADLEGEKAIFADFSQKIGEALSLCGEEMIDRIASSFDPAVLDVRGAPLADLLERLRLCLSKMNELENWIRFKALLASLEEKEALSFVHATIKEKIAPEQVSRAFRKLFYCQWIDAILAEVPALSSFSRVSQDNAVRVFAEKDEEQFEINKAVIRAQVSAMRPQLDLIAPGSAVATLLREGEKKRKQKSIRALLAETGEVVQRIKPCFLMSPLSVSTFLAPDAVRFDTVLFDEASQIFPQDAIGAIYRAEQLIVVGDSRQMPPSNFFNATLEAEDADEEAGDVTDFESILDICSTSMRQLRLKWHYRSRDESLIAFSNKNFYDGDLITFPSPKRDAGFGVTYHHVDGIFDRKSHTNRAEAEAVVDLIFKHIKEYPERSLGVVAFSVAQQDLIDRLLSKRRQLSQSHETFFSRDAKEPFFVKNLETVQGDERDTIIFSIAYGKDAQGRLLHNFGPLNRSGGERRLNVAVTRARCRVQVVSSMHHSDIDLKRTSSQGARLLKEYLDYAESGNIALERAVSISPFDEFDSEFELEVCSFLREHGFSVDTQIGCSGFRIDLGVKRPGSSDYVLGIECDGATYHSSKNARDRDRLRQGILERMGWLFYRVWSTEWFKNRSQEQSRLLEAAYNAVNGAAEASPEKKAAQAAAEAETSKAFEEAAAKKGIAFPRYKAADVSKACSQYPLDFKRIAKAVLDVEAPLSESLLLKRIALFYGSDRVTAALKRGFDEGMRGCEELGIMRNGGFLYLNDGREISLRAPGDISRQIKEIAPEELASGMVELLKENVSVDRSGLYKQLAQIATEGTSARLGKSATDAMDAAFDTLRGRVVMEGEQVSLKS